MDDSEDESGRDLAGEVESEDEPTDTLSTEDFSGKTYKGRSHSELSDGERLATTRIVQSIANSEWISDAKKFEDGEVVSEDVETLVTELSSTDERGYVLVDETPQKLFVGVDDDTMELKDSYYEATLDSDEVRFTPSHEREDVTGDERVQLTQRMSPEMYERVEDYADDIGNPVNSTVNLLIEQGLRSLGR